MAVPPVAALAIAPVLGDVQDRHAGNRRGLLHREGRDLRRPGGQVGSELGPLAAGQVGFGDVLPSDDAGGAVVVADGEPFVYKARMALSMCSGRRPKASNSPAEGSPMPRPYAKQGTCCSIFEPEQRSLAFQPAAIF